MAAVFSAKPRDIEHHHVSDEDSAEDIIVPCWLFDPDSAQNTQVPSDRPLSFSELYSRYVNQCRESEGFDVDAVPEGTCLLGRISPFRIEYDPELLTDLSKIALAEYNSKYEGENYEFVELVKANKQPVCGIMFYITFRAKDKDTCLTFQAKVWKQISPRGTKVMLCRKKNNKLV